MKFSIKGFFSKCDQIRNFLRIWSHLLKKISNGKLHFLCSEIENIDYIVTKLFIVATYSEKLPHLKSHEHLIKWSCEFDFLAYNL